MPTTAIQNVTSVRSRSEAQGVDQPGTFSVFDDQTASFTGNGAVSFEQATSHYLQYMARTQTELQPFANSSEAARFGAHLSIQQNPACSHAAPGDVVPQGQAFNMNGASLKQLLAPFANNLEKLSAAVQNMSTPSGGANPYTGRVNNAPGRGLPVDLP